jgi:hypothetical protein
MRLAAGTELSDTARRNELSGDKRGDLEAPFHVNPKLFGNTETQTVTGLTWKYCVAGMQSPTRSRLSLRHRTCLRRTSCDCLAMWPLSLASVM